MFNVKCFKGKVIKFIANILGGVKTINRIFIYLDKKNYDPVNTINYVIVAGGGGGLCAVRQHNRHQGRHSAGGSGNLASLG